MVFCTHSFLQTVPEFLGKEEQLIGQPPLNITRSTYSSYCHDNTWILAHALNRTLMSKFTANIDSMAGVYMVSITLSISLLIMLVCNIVDLHEFYQSLPVRLFNAYKVRG